MEILFTACATRTPKVYVKRKHTDPNGPVNELEAGTGLGRCAPRRQEKIYPGEKNFLENRQAENGHKEYSAVRAETAAESTRPWAKR